MSWLFVSHVGGCHTFPLADPRSARFPKCLATSTPNTTLPNPPPTKPTERPVTHESTCNSPSYEHWNVLEGTGIRPSRSIGTFLGAGFSRSLARRHFPGRSARYADLQFTVTSRAFQGVQDPVRLRRHARLPLSGQPQCVNAMDQLRARVLEIDMMHRTFNYMLDAANTCSNAMDHVRARRFKLDSMILFKEMRPDTCSLHM